MPRPRRNPQHKRRAMSAEDRADLRDAKAAMKRLRKHGGYLMYDARTLSKVRL